MGAEDVQTLGVASGAVDGGAATVDDVRAVVDDAMRAGSDATNAKYEALERQIVVLGDSVALLASSDEASESEDGETVYLVRLAPEQVDTFKAFARVLTTEGLLLVIVFAIACGLMVWQVFSSRWV